MTLYEAFGELINTRGIYKTLGLSVQTISNFRNRFNKEGNSEHGKRVTDDKMRELLKKAGWKQKETWTKPK